MKQFKKTALSLLIAVSVSPVLFANSGPVLNLSPNTTHTLQFPAGVESVSSSSGAVSVNSQTNSLIINTISPGSSNLEFFLVGESTPRYLTVNVNEARSTSSSMLHEPIRAITQTPVITVPAFDTSSLEPVVNEQPAEADWTSEYDIDPIHELNDSAEVILTETVAFPALETSMLISPAQDERLAANTDLLNNPELFISFEEAVNRAFQYNPLIRSALHAFSASASDIGFASGGWRPVVDFNASYGAERRDWENYDGRSSFSGGAAGLTLTQSLYDGLRTRNEVKRFEAAQLVRYYELLDQVEGTTLEAFNAYLDVMRFREMVLLAEENLERHIEVFNQLESSAAAGVARRADFEQISGRLSLAEANLITEASNLHDVSARYLRVFGELPGYNLMPVSLDSSFIPSDIRQALRMAYEGNPSFHAAIRNIESQQAAVETNKSAFRPQVNLAARLNTRENDDQGFNNRRNDGQIALEFRYNLYNGGRDDASLQRSLEEVNIAKSQRDTACVNLRQNLQIAVNDSQKLDSQLPMLNQHRLSSNSVRQAYKNQFDIGQRTLLDVLDAENEYYQASRAYTGATYDREIASARALNELGQLLPALSVVSSGLPSLSELGASAFKVDANSACPDIDVNNSILPSRLL